MLIPIHVKITRDALEKIFNPKVLEIVIRAIKKQDAIKGQKFAYAFAAAVKRTAAELEIIKENSTTGAFNRYINV